MNYVRANINLDQDKLQLAKLKGINISEVCREALDTRLKIGDGSIELLEKELLEIDNKIDELTLEKTLIKKQIQLLLKEDTVTKYREDKYQKHKHNLAFMYNTNSLDFDLLRDLFRFKNVKECRDWIMKKLETECLISTT